MSLCAGPAFGPLLMPVASSGLEKAELGGQADLLLALTAQPLSNYPREPCAYTQLPPCLSSEALSLERSLGILFSQTFGVLLFTHPARCVRGTAPALFLQLLPLHVLSWDHLGPPWLGRR